jgi:hypothetical protein
LSTPNLQRFLPAEITRFVIGESLGWINLRAGAHFAALTASIE